MTVQVTVVVPSGYDDGALLLTGNTEQLSPVTGVPSVTLVATHELESVPTVKPAGAVIVGSSVSLTVTLKLQLGPVELVQVTGVVPTGKAKPEGGSQVTVPQPVPDGAV